MAASHSHFESDEGQTSQPKQPEEEPEDWSIMVENNLEVNQRSSSVVSIFRVPSILITGKLGREAYVPTRVPLGPYHHESKELTPMEKHKARAVRRMGTRFNKSRQLVNDQNNIMQFFYCARGEIEKLQKLPKKIRDSYHEEEINYNEEALASMLTMDGCFILEILRTLRGDSLEDSGDSYEPLFERDKILYSGKDILHDILKLENQVPFMVLLKLLQLEFKPSDIDAKRKLFEMLHPASSDRQSFLSVLYPFNYEKDKSEMMEKFLSSRQEVHHLLGLIHTYFNASHHSRNRDQHAGNDDGRLNANSHNGYTTLPAQDSDNARGDMAVQDEDSPTGNAKGDVACDHIHRAIHLANAGIKFHPCDGGIANIKFDQKSATLFLPPITIGDSTETLFRNLIAFEMCKPSDQFNSVSRYVFLMDQLIDSEEDAALLRKSGIITNNLGSYGEVAQLFNGLCKGVTVNLQGAFDNLAEKVNKQYNNKFRVQLTELVKEYFSSPWKTLGMLGGIALMFLTTVQTIIAILTLYK